MPNALIFGQWGCISLLDVRLLGFRTSAAPATCLAQTSRKALQVRPVPLKCRIGLALLNRVSS
ncbi:hypothetical protein QUB63_11465 [Microcoleus sp. ARI1-B5]|uniref:hypothetical protein n=1 Tax=unclassified Microcoleus TaxID=2642155 RepID=UPI002FD13611